MEDNGIIYKIYKVYTHGFFVEAGVVRQKIFEGECSYSLKSVEIISKNYVNRNLTIPYSIKDLKKDQWALCLGRDLNVKFEKLGLVENGNREIYISGNYIRIPYNLVPFYFYWCSEHKVNNIYKLEERRDLVYKKVQGEDSNNIIEVACPATKKWVYSSITEIVRYKYEDGILIDDNQYIDIKNPYIYMEYNSDYPEIVGKEDYSNYLQKNSEEILLNKFGIIEQSNRWDE